MTFSGVSFRRTAFLALILVGVFGVGLAALIIHFQQSAPSTDRQAENSPIVTDDSAPSIEDEAAFSKSLLDPESPAADPTGRQQVTLSSEELHALILDVESLVELSTLRDNLYSTYTSAFKGIVNADVQAKLVAQVRERSEQYVDLSKRWRLFADVGPYLPWRMIDTSVVQSRVDRIGYRILGGEYLGDDVKFVRFSTWHYTKDIKELCRGLKTVQQLSSGLLNAGILDSTTVASITAGIVTDADAKIAQVHRRHSDVARSRDGHMAVTMDFVQQRLGKAQDEAPQITSGSAQIEISREFAIAMALGGNDEADDAQMVRCRALYESRSFFGDDETRFENVFLRNHIYALAISETYAKIPPAIDEIQTTDRKMAANAAAGVVTLLAKQVGVSRNLNGLKGLLTSLADRRELLNSTDAEAALAAVDRAQSLERSRLSQKEFQAALDHCRSASPPQNAVLGCLQIAEDQLALGKKAGAETALAAAQAIVQHGSMARDYQSIEMLRQCIHTEMKLGLKAQAQRDIKQALTRADELPNGPKDGDVGHLQAKMFAHLSELQYELGMKDDAAQSLKRASDAAQVWLYQYQTTHLSQDLDDQIARRSRNRSAFGPIAYIAALYQGQEELDAALKWLHGDDLFQLDIVCKAAVSAGIRGDTARGQNLLTQAQKIFDDRLASGYRAVSGRVWIAVGFGALRRVAKVDDLVDHLRYPEEKTRFLICSSVGLMVDSTIANPFSMLEDDDVETAFGSDW